MKSLKRFRKTQRNATLRTTFVGFNEASPAYTKIFRIYTVSNVLHTHSSILQYVIGFDHVANGHVNTMQVL